jgi:hypothetical protein
VGCEFHLYWIQSTGVTRRKGDGIIKQLRPPWEMDETCVLDVAEQGGRKLREIGDYLGLTRERIRQLLKPAERRLRHRAERGMGRGVLNNE